MNKKNFRLCAIARFKTIYNQTGDNPPMKVTKRQLQRLIKEELQKVFEQTTPINCPPGYYGTASGCKPYGPASDVDPGAPDVTPAPLRPPLEAALPETEARKRTAYEAQRDLDWAIKAHNFWGSQDPASEDFVNAQAAVETFRNEMVDMGVEPGSITPYPESGPRTEEGDYLMGKPPGLQFEFPPQRHETGMDL
jgi:hypothetical protein